MSESETPCLDTTVPHSLGGLSRKEPFSALLSSVSKDRSGEPRNRTNTHPRINVPHRHSSAEIRDGQSLALFSVHLLREGQLGCHKGTPLPLSSPLWQPDISMGGAPCGGHITLQLLKISDAFRVELREEMIGEGLFPPA